MEIIGWISLIVIIGSLIFLGISAFGTYKTMKPKMDKLQETSKRLQKQSEGIQVEAEVLKEHQQQLMNDVEGKKQAVMFTVEEAKRTPAAVKQLGSALQLIDKEKRLKLPFPGQKKRQQAGDTL